MKYLAFSLALALSGCSGDYSGLGPAMAGGFANGLNQANAQNMGVQPTQGVGYQNGMPYSFPIYQQPKTVKCVQTQTLTGVETQCYQY